MEIHIKSDIKRTLRFEIVHKKRIFITEFLTFKLGSTGFPLVKFYLSSRMGKVL